VELKQCATQRIHVLANARALPVEANPVPIILEKQKALEVAGREMRECFF
jgi:hypothetical protein